MRDELRDKDIAQHARHEHRNEADAGEHRSVALIILVEELREQASARLSYVLSGARERRSQLKLKALTWAQNCHPINTHQLRNAMSICTPYRPLARANSDGRMSGGGVQTEYGAFGLSWIRSRYL